MAFTIIDASGPILAAKISGELTPTEVSQMQAAALEAIRRCGKISALFILEDLLTGMEARGRLGRCQLLDRAR